MIKSKKKICKKCGKETYIFSKGMCKLCQPKKPLSKKKSSISKISSKGIIKKEEKKKWLEELHQWEFELWDKREDKNGYCYCFETGTPMHRSLYRQNLCVYSHCFSKSTHKKWAMEEWNLLIVLPGIHNQWEADSSKTPKMLKYFKEIKQKYE